MIIDSLVFFFLSMVWRLFCKVLLTVLCFDDLHTLIFRQPEKVCIVLKRDSPERKENTQFLRTRYCIYSSPATQKNCTYTSHQEKNYLYSLTPNPPSHHPNTTSSPSSPPPSSPTTPPIRLQSQPSSPS